ncbi:MAG: hypothetical protein JJU11_12260, partial [Candidatus Sumerlaeia bacterium]|nr:hypothetical protein [Candidatus Sumerlaeia bacterium]
TDTQSFTITVTDFPQTMTFTPPAITKANIDVVETGGETVVRANEFNDTYELVVDSDVEDTVVIIATPPAILDLGSGPGEPHSIVFGAGDKANDSRTLTITAIDDGVTVLPATFVITHTVTSSDPAYADTTVPNLSVTVEEPNTPVMDWEQLVD